MADYKENARGVLNAFLWDQLQDSGIMSSADYRPDGFTKSLVPIIPSQEIPEFNNLLPDSTYIVYDFEVEGYDDDWWICEESMLYSIISPNYGKILEITEFMIDLFRRVDESGHDVQMFNPKTNIVKFYSVSLSSANSPAPFETEGGRMIGTVQISYKYSRILNSQGRFS